MTTVDTQKSIMTYIYTKLTGDDGLKTLVGGTVRVFLVWANIDAEFPYIVQRVDITADDFFPMRRATEYIDLWSSSPNADEILAIRKRIIELLDELEFSTDEADTCRLWLQADSFIPEVEPGIWHYALQFNLRYYRRSEAGAIISR